MITQKRKAIRLFFKSLLFTLAAMIIFVVGFLSAEYFFTKF